MRACFSVASVVSKIPHLDGTSFPRNITDEQRDLLEKFSALDKQATEHPKTGFLRSAFKRVCLSALFKICECGNVCERACTANVYVCVSVCVYKGMCFCVCECMYACMYVIV